MAARLLIAYEFMGLVETTLIFTAHTTAKYQKSIKYRGNEAEKILHMSQDLSFTMLYFTLLYFASLH